MPRAAVGLLEYEAAAGACQTTVGGELLAEASEWRQLESRMNEVERRRLQLAGEQVVGAVANLLR